MLVCIHTMPFQAGEYANIITRYHSPVILYCSVFDSTSLSVTNGLICIQFKVIRAKPSIHIYYF